MRKTIDQYVGVAKKIAEESNWLLVDTLAVYNEVLKELYSATLAWDHVLPSAAGHMVLARAFLIEIGPLFFYRDPISFY